MQGLSAKYRIMSDMIEYGDVAYSYKIIIKKFTPFYTHYS